MRDAEVASYVTQHWDCRKDSYPIHRGLILERRSVRRFSAGLSAVGMRWNGIVRSVIKRLGIVVTAARYRTRVTHTLLI